MYLLAVLVYCVAACFTSDERVSLHGVVFTCAHRGAALGGLTGPARARAPRLLVKLVNLCMAYNIGRTGAVHFVLFNTNKLMPVVAAYTVSNAYAVFILAWSIAELGVACVRPPGGARRPGR